MVHLSRSNGLNAAHEEGARRDLSAPALVSGHQRPFKSICAVFTRLQWRLAASYEFVALVNHTERFPAGRWCAFRRSLPIAVNKRYRDRAGKLDYFLLETLPTAHKCNEQPETLEGKHHASA